LTHPPPALIKTLKAWEKKLAHATHHALYLIMILIPLSGISMALYSKYGIKWFGIPLAQGLGDDAMRDFFKETHKAVGILLLILIGLHVLAVIKHTFVDKNGTLKRMIFK
jgi:cytochrome b561